MLYFEPLSTIQSEFLLEINRAAMQIIEQRRLKMDLAINALRDAIDHADCPEGNAIYDELPAMIAERDTLLLEMKKVQVTIENIASDSRRGHVTGSYDLTKAIPESYLKTNSL